jgi:hypothetical protein
MPQTIKIVGVHDDGKMQVAVVEVDGSIVRPAGKDGVSGYYNLVLSFDPRSGVHAKDAESVLMAVAASRGIDGLRNLSDPVDLTATPRFVYQATMPPKLAAPASAAKPQPLAKKP